MNNEETQKFLDNLRKAGKSASLNSERKASFRGILANFMATNPHEINLGKKANHFSAMGKFFSKPFFASAFGIILILAGGAGTAMAANNSLPGDVLYSVKLNVNEKVKTALAGTAEDKADVRLELIDRRMEEGLALSAKGTLDADIQIKLEALISRYQSELKDIFASSELNEGQKLGLITSSTARLEAMIRVHENALGRFSNDEDSNRFKDNLQKKLEQSGKDSDELVGKVSSEDSNNPDQFKEASSNKIEAASKILENTKSYIEAKSNVGANQHASVKSSESAQQQLKLAQDKLDEARKDFTDSKFKDAFLSANDSIRLAQQAKAIVRIGFNNKLDVDLEDNGAVKGRNTDEDSYKGSGRSSEVRNSNSIKSEDDIKINNGLQLKLK